MIQLEEPNTATRICLTTVFSVAIGLSLIFGILALPTAESYAEIPSFDFSTSIGMAYSRPTMDVPVNGENIYIVGFDYPSGGNSRLAMSSNGGEDWSQHGIPNDIENSFPSISVIGNDSLYLVSGGGSIGWNLYRSDTGGANWSYVSYGDNGGRALDPRLWVNASEVPNAPVDQDIYLAYVSDVEGIWTDYFVYFDSSHDNGTSWTGARKVNSILSGYPRLLIGDSTIYIFFLDIVWDGLFEAKFVKSANWGNTWSTETTLQYTSELFESPICIMVTGATHFDEQRALMSLSVGNYTRSEGMFGYFWYSNETFQLVGKHDLTNDGGTEAITQIYFQSIYSFYDNTLHFCWSDMVSGSVRYAAMRPKPIDFKINDGALYVSSADVTLSIALDDILPRQSFVRFSNDNLSYTEWEAFTLSKDWMLGPSEGTKTVYLQVKSLCGPVITYNDSIILDTSPPTGSVVIQGNSTYTSSTVVMLSIHAEDLGSGVANMRFSSDNQTWSEWEGYGTSAIYVFTGEDGEKTVFVQFTDNTGRTSTAKDEIILDTTDPIPVIQIPMNITVNETVAFDATASTDNIGIANYSWILGDGSTGSGSVITHRYAEAGIYTIVLTVTDRANNTESQSVVVIVSEEQELPPPPPEEPERESAAAMWALGISVVALAIALAVAIFMLLKRKKGT